MKKFESIIKNSFKTNNQSETSIANKSLKDKIKELIKKNEETIKKFEKLKEQSKDSQKKMEYLKIISKFRTRQITLHNKLHGLDLIMNSYSKNYQNNIINSKTNLDNVNKIKNAFHKRINSSDYNYSAIYSVLIADIIDRIDIIPKEYVSYIDDALNDIDYSEASSLETLAPLLRVRLCIDPKYKVKKADYDKMKSLVGAYEKLCSESESYKLYLSEDYILYRMMLGMKIPDDCAEQFKKECFDGINLRFEDKDLEGYYYRMILKNIENGL